MKGTGVTVKNMNLTDSAKIILLAASAMIAILVCGTCFKITGTGRAGINTASGQITSMASDYSDLDLSLYEGSLIKGSEVVSLIKKAAGEDDYLAIEVATLDGSTRAYNYRFDYGKLTLSKDGADLEPVADHSQYGYINRAANYLGASYLDGNGNIVCLRFEQQK